MDTDRTADLNSEAGMTLIEIMLSVVLSGIVIAALVGGIMAYMQGATATTYLLNETPELQLVATHFGTDVQSADTVTKPAAGATPACGSLSGAGGTTIVDLRWNDHFDTTSAATPVVVSYTYAPATYELRRFACRNGALTDQTALVTHVKPLETPDLTCDLAPCGSGPTKPTRVDLAFQVCTANAAGNDCLDPYIPANYTGIRRLPS